MNPKSPIPNPLRIAFIGAGNMARLHLHALRRVRTPHVVVGVQDRDEHAARLFAALADTTSYRTLAELFAEARPDLVHICTTAGAHFEAARAALRAGAHIYVEKPFVETAAEAEELLGLAAQRGLLVCGGHQQVRDSSYQSLLARARDLGEVVQVDSQFTFRPVGSNAERGSATVLAEQLVDVLPHPLYTLVDALERLVPDSESFGIDVGSIVAGPTDLHAILRTSGGKCFGRLSVSLRARPIASSLSVSATGGTLTADFLRSSVVGAGNAGTSPVEKAANPLLEALQLAVRASTGVARRILQGGDYPGLAELIEAFYAAVATGAPAPVSPEHLRRVTTLFEELAANVRSAARAAANRRPSSPSLTRAEAPVVVVTGARGYYGREITKHLARRGYRVRGISRSVNSDDPYVHEWVSLDLSRAVPPEAFAGAEAVVHAAAASSGDYDSQQRHSIDATRNVLKAMRVAGVSRLVYVSSISVLRPPRTPWEEQDENTPLTGPEDRQYGSYVWGKSGAERVVTTEAPGLGIDSRIIRPGALVDWTSLEPPGIIGRRLFGPWHLGFGRPALPVPVCEVGKAAAVVAWSVAEFAEAPPVLNLMDPAIPTRRRLLQEFKRHGWRGRFVWVPLPFFTVLVHSARYGLALSKLRRPTPLALYGILKPRNYSTELSQHVLRRALQDPAPVSTTAEPDLATTPA